MLDWWMRDGQKLQCNWCRRKLASVFRVCPCRKYYCPNCIDPKIHDCSKLKGGDTDRDSTGVKDGVEPL